MAAADKKQVMDVKKPGKVVANATARPVIVGHGSMIKDPMVKEKGLDELSEIANNEAMHPTKPSESPTKVQMTVQPPEKTMPRTASEPTEAKTPESGGASSQAEKTDEQSQEESDVPKNGDNTSSTDAAETDNDDGDTTDESAIVGAVADQAKLNGEDKKKAEEEAAKQEAIDKLIQDKTYFVKVGQVQRRRNTRVLAIILISIALVVVGALIVVRMGIVKRIDMSSIPLIGAKKQSTADAAVVNASAKSDVASPAPVVQVVPQVTVNTYLYALANADKTYTLTLTGADNKIAQQTKTSSKPHTLFVFSDGSYAVKQDRSITKNSTRSSDYYVMSKDGYKQFSETVQNAIKDVVYPVKDRTLVTYDCANGCQSISDLHVNIIDTATDKVTPVSLQNVKAKYDGGLALKGVTPSRDGLVFLADTLSDYKTFSSAVSAKLGSGSSSRLVDQDTYLKAAEGIKWRRYVVKTNLSGAITSAHPVDVDYTYYGKYWISPTGSYMIYSNGGERGRLQYIDVAKNSKSSITFDSSWSTESWGGRTVTADPLWSPDGTKIFFATYGKSVQDAIAAYITLPNKTVTKIASSLGTNESYMNPLWADNQTVWYGVEVESTKNMAVSTPVRNEQYDLNTKKVSAMPFTHGAFQGIADGTR